MKYGDQTALLHSWTGFYLDWLTLPAILGCVLFVILFIIDLVTSDSKLSDGLKNTVYEYSNIAIVVFGVLLSIYFSFIDALWRRKENTLALQWGTLELSAVEVQRPQFHGKWEIDRVTGKWRKRRESEVDFVIKRAVSFLLITIFIGIDVGFIIGIFWYQTAVSKTSWSQQQFVSFLICVLNQVMSYIYISVAKRLNDWENIEFESQHYNSLCVKRFLFEFINQYSSPFYIAYLQGWTTEGCDGSEYCLPQLISQLIIAFFMFFIIKVAKLLWLRAVRHYKKEKTLKLYSEEHSMSREAADKEMPRTEFKFALDTEHESTLEDHMEFVILYGYVVLFSATAPFLAMFMLITMWACNAWTRKVQELFLRRPFPHHAQGVGVWNDIMLCISIMAAFTNPGLVVFTAFVFPFHYLNHYWVTFLGFSIGLLLCKTLINLALPKMPKAVKLGLEWGNRVAQERLNNDKTRISQSLDITTIKVESV